MSSRSSEPREFENKANDRSFLRAAARTRRNSPLVVFELGFGHQYPRVDLPQVRLPPSLTYTCPLRVSLRYEVTDRLLFYRRGPDLSFVATPQGVLHISVNTLELNILMNT